MNKCPACGNTQEAVGVCEKCGAQTEATEAEASKDSSSEAAPAGDSGEGAAK